MFACMSRLWFGHGQSGDCGGSADGAGQEFNCVVHRSSSRMTSPSLETCEVWSPEMVICL
ncbi:hypothetical protein SynMINOS11_02055 [Synechococcus sp. Minos11]|nr:hypothetical protein SynMINOS11_02055 [Synechococcus sp. Minos11]